MGDIIRKTKSTTNDKKDGFNMQHEYTLVFAKNHDKLRFKGELKDTSGFSNPDNDPNGLWRSDSPSARLGSNFPIENPYTGAVDYPPKQRAWSFSREIYEKKLASGAIKFKEKHSPNTRGFIYKRYLHELRSEYKTLNSLMGADNMYMNQRATKDLQALFPDYRERVFDFPKPANYIKKLIEYSTEDGDIVLDFFAGSGTTAQAVLELNNEQEEKRKYILVQLPELIKEKTELYAKGYKTLPDIMCERIKRVGKVCGTDEGFRYYKETTCEYNTRDEEIRAIDYYRERGT